MARQLFLKYLSIAFFCALLLLGCNSDKESSDSPTWTPTTASENNRDLKIKQVCNNGKCYHEIPFSLDHEIKNSYCQKDDGLYLGPPDTIIAADKPKLNSFIILSKTTGSIRILSTSDFSTIKKLQIPSDIYEPTKGAILINDSRHIFYFKTSKKENDAAPYTRIDSIWLWDGTNELSNEITTPYKCTPNKDECDFFSDISVDANTAAIYKIFNRIVDFRPSSDGHGIRSIKRDAEIYKYTFSGTNSPPTRETIGVIHYSWHSCNSGYCSEETPLPYFLNQNSTIDNFIAIRHFGNGQIDNIIYGETYLTKKEQNWSLICAKDYLTQPYLKLSPDNSCCGWTNGSSDSISLVTNNIHRTVYDEDERFNNASFQVAFTPSNARLSPDLNKVAYTVEKDSTSVDSLKNGFLYDYDGQKTTDIPGNLREAILRMPVMEVVFTSTHPPTPTYTIKDATPKGWLDNDRLLFYKDTENKYYILDTKTGEASESPVQFNENTEIIMR